MWQVLFAAAAAAGSGILAKKLISPINTEAPISDCQNDLKCALDKSSHPSIVHLNDAFGEKNSEEKREAFSDDGEIFRFSSPDAGAKEFWKNSPNGLRGLKKNGGLKREKKNGAAGGGRKEVGRNQIGSGSGKRVSICLKKRRTGTHSAGKCESCASKDNSFGWGVGLGIMYMMSAGNAEISKLNSAMDQTVKTVQELKVEISRRKSLHNMNVSVAENEAETKRYHGPLFTDLSSKSRDNVKTSGPALPEEGESASGILTVDQHPEVLDFDRLEMELDSELQKLPWVATGGSCFEGITDIFEAEDSAKEPKSENLGNSDPYPNSGVLPAELDQKLCHLLIEQQESQIGELEGELHHAHSKLHQKEAELQALKVCVKSLTNFSLANASDEEAEENEYEDVKRVTDGSEDKLGLEPAKLTLGMKRTVGCEAYICS